MKLTDCDVEIADWKTEATQLKAIRRIVFVEEQKVPVELEWDGLDPDCTHFMVRSLKKVIATARLKPDGQIGRMAVLQAYRGHGVGTKLMTVVLSHAVTTGLDRVYLHAQVQVIDFYQRFGFAAEGEEFMDAGIPHRAMYKKI